MAPWILALLVLASACAPRPVLTDRVRIFDDVTRPEREWGYDPVEIRVPAGTTVLLINEGAVFHTITSDDRGRPFDYGVDPMAEVVTGSGAGPTIDMGAGTPPGGRITVRFMSPGRYAYHCGVHPDMKGVVHVCDGACR